MKLVSKEIPKIAENGLLVKNMFAGVNFIDTYHRSGIYPKRSDILGMEGAGEVVAVGEKVTSIKPGDKVAWPGTISSYAEFVTMPQNRVVKVPDGVDMQTACAAMLQGMTAHYLVTSVHQIKPGDWALVHAAAGGVGQLLVQMIKSRGGKVIATCGNEAKAEIARAAGADEVVIGYTDFAAPCKKIADGKGVHVVYDGVGKDTFTQSLDSLRPRGMMALYGGASGQVPPFDLQGLNSRGSLVITRPALGHFIADDEEFQWRAREIFSDCAAGKLKFAIGAVFPIEEVASAHDALEGRKTTGKVLLSL